MRAAGVLSPFGCAFRLVERRVEASRVSYRARRGRGVLLGLGVLDVFSSSSMRWSYSSKACRSSSSVVPDTSSPRDSTAASSSSCSSFAFLIVSCSRSSSALRLCASFFSAASTSWAFNLRPLSGTWCRVRRARSRLTILARNLVVGVAVMERLRVWSCGLLVWMDVELWCGERGLCSEEGGVVGARR